jgi:hypothetical protein
MEAGVSLAKGYVLGIDGIVRRLVMFRATTPKSNPRGFKFRLQLDASSQGPRAVGGGDRTKTRKIPHTPSLQEGIN